MGCTLGDLAAFVGGTVRGDADVVIERVAPIDTAGDGDITFVSNERYVPKARTTGASAIIVGPGFEDVGTPLLEVANPYAAMARIVGRVMPQREHPAPGVHDGAVVDPTARLGEGVAVSPAAVVSADAVVGAGTVLYPQVFVGRGAVIGADCVFHPGVKIYDGARIGDRVTAQSNTVIGSDGFGFAPDGRRYVPIPQVGGCVVGDDVHIGSNVTINRGALGDTTVGRGCKIDSNVVVAHNVVVGEDTVLVAQVGISGSVTIGNHVTLAGQVGVAGHLEIGDNVTVAAQSGVAGSIEADQVLLGSPAMPIQLARRCYVCIAKLPDLAKDVRQIKRQMRSKEDAPAGDGER